MNVTLITGGAGFVGTNTAERLLSEGRRVRILDDLSRPGVERNLKWLEDRHGSLLEVELGDIRDRARVNAAMHGVDQIFHFAAQVAVTTSLEEPLVDLAVNLQGTINVLEEARGRAHPPSLVFTSTNKVYGSLDDVELQQREDRYEPADPQVLANGISERQPLQFRTPYGCSKGASDQYVLDWSYSYGLPTVVFRMSCIYGPHQFGTEDQGWVAHFVIRALEQDPITIYGDGRQVRDVLFVEDLVDALLLAQRDAHRFAGTAFNIGGGTANAVSLREVLSVIGELTPLPEVHWESWRAGDQRYFVTDHSCFTTATGWRPRVSVREGVGRLRDWLLESAESSSVAA